eukprot:CAMPEP_0119125322 /NCGR_PEP_ID=MMETSP1310-20130426/4641_1 /TAXON_ID=464262 /ORGANISM="Genus nov. species nov., Strain RCC2339" /LENGTH=80 /DNA_ID=CAMNT_0007115381 /DNA_START=53 /DNA_END=295 /DNA_ORIENTATION=+
MAEVARHNTRGSCWLVANGNVYDVTKYLRSNEHPPGARPILRKAGTDATEDFDFHSSEGQSVWDQYRIGRVKDHSTCLIS